MSSANHGKSENYYSDNKCVEPIFFPLPIGNAIPFSVKFLKWLLSHILKASKWNFLKNIDIFGF